MKWEYLVEIVDNVYYAQDMLNKYAQEYWENYHISQDLTVYFFRRRVD